LEVTLAQHRGNSGATPEQLGRDLANSEKDVGDPVRPATPEHRRSRSRATSQQLWTNDFAANQELYASRRTKRWSNSGSTPLGLGDLGGGRLSALVYSGLSSDVVVRLARLRQQRPEPRHLHHLQRRLPTRFPTPAPPTMLGRHAQLLTPRRLSLT